MSKSNQYESFLAKIIIKKLPWNSLNPKIS